MLNIMFWRLIGVAFGLGLAFPASAHPHVFVDTGLEVIFDGQGAVTGIRISWTYDEYYSLVIVEERGIDPDYDGASTPEENTALAGFDMAWDAGFAGDTYALQASADLALSRPGEVTAQYIGGKITSTHLRTFDVPVQIGGRVWSCNPMTRAIIRLTQLSEHLC